MKDCITIGKLEVWIPLHELDKINNRDIKKNITAIISREKEKFAATSFDGNIKPGIFRDNLKYIKMTEKIIERFGSESSYKEVLNIHPSGISMKIDKSKIQMEMRFMDKNARKLPGRKYILGSVNAYIKAGNYEDPDNKISLHPACTGSKDAKDILNEIQRIIKEEKLKL